MTSFQDLARQVESLAPPTPDVDTLVARGERELHRRRVAAVVTAAAVVVVMIAGGVLVGGGDPDSRGPIEPPGRHDRAPRTETRKIAFGDGVPGRAIHFGDRTVGTGVAFAQIDITDDGFLYGTGGYLGDGRIWFSDGGTPEQVGSHVCIDPHGGPSAVATGNSGSLAAWFICARPAPQSLVVFDTTSRREVVRRELSVCPSPRGRFGPCAVDALVDRHVYFTETYYRRGGTGRVAERTYLFDLDSGAVSTTSPAALADDLRQHSRGLVVGDSWATGTPTTGNGQHFDVVGSRLVPTARTEDGEEFRTTAYDTATRREVALRLPAGYRHRTEGFALFEWLDDTTVALVRGGGWGWFPGYGDILTCRLPDGRCDLTVRGRANGKDSPPRIVPHLGLPG